jgi:DNA-binding transcriptional ArsR family regulator
MDVKSLTRIAGLIGEAGRIQMLITLLDGNSHSASELAIAADASPQTASSHLSKLLSGGLIVAGHKGRQRMFRLKNAEVAAAIEALGALAGDSGMPAMREMRFARTCYDHLAGVLAIALRNQLLRSGAIERRQRDFALTDSGELLLRSLEIDADSLYAQRRSLGHKCLDWTERHHHIGGALGAALLSRFLEWKWLARMRDTRAVRVTYEGERELERRFGLDCAALRVRPASSRDE